jgi:hypothetical protein
VKAREWLATVLHCAAQCRVMMAVMVVVVVVMMMMMMKMMKMMMVGIGYQALLRP